MSDPMPPPVHGGAERGFSERGFAEHGFSEHRAALLADVEPVPARPCGLVEAIGRVLAEDVSAAVSLPRFDHAAMDGFAVSAARTPGRLPVVGVVEAGDVPRPVVDGGAVRIMTGAPMPPGTDAVVPIEQCRVDPGAPAGEVTLPTARAGAHIRRAGEDVAAGDVVARAGSTLDPRTAGLCAATGRGAVSVHPAPRVVVVTTGSELVAAGTDAGHLSAAGVHDSTAITLVAELRARGADASHRGPVGDDPEAFLVALHEAVREADLVITSGGVSAGDRDVVKASLRQHPDFWFGPVAVRPGRPQGHGHLSVDRAEGARRVPVVTLPGTPAASYLTFLAFVVPLVDRLAGRLPDGVATDATAVLAEPVRARPDRVVLLAGRRDGDGRVRVLPGHVGHSQRLLAAAEVVLIVPAADTDLPAGARIAVIELAPGRRIAE